MEPLRAFEVRDGFADPNGSDNPNMPTMRMVFTFSETNTGSRVSTKIHFDSAADLEALVAMGMDEGTRAAMAQMDDVLADLTSFATGNPCAVQILSDTQVRVSRTIRRPVEQVWQAHHDESLVRRWMLGPDGWTIPVCEIAANVGDTYRFEWQQTDGEARFGLTGQLLETAQPHRTVSTEQMIGMDGSIVTNELTLTPTQDGTLLSIVITYVDIEQRDTILATGMVDGMETSYARLEHQALSATER